MDRYLTEIEGPSIAGPDVIAESEEEAQRIANTYDTSIGKVKVIGKLVIEFDENFMN